mgnify:CR=1 FL=1
MKAIIKQDARTGVFFGFIIQQPGICAQGNTPQEVTDKLARHKDIFAKRVENSDLEFEVIS